MEEKMTFEQANAKLVQTVKAMENKNITLQDSLEYYAKACELIAYCKKELETFRGKFEDVHERIEKIYNLQGDENE